MARRADTLTDTRPLPVTHDLLVAHYLPAPPDCQVTRLQRTATFVGQQQVPLSEAVDQARQLATARREDVTAAAVDEDPQRFATAVRASAAADTELEARERALDIAAALVRRLNLSAGHAQSFGDPVFRAWGEECTAIRAEWRESMRWVDQMMHDVPRDVYAEVRRERLDQGLRGFVAQH